MTKYQKRHRLIATFFLLIFFPTLLPTHIYSSTNGPVAPEATAFEPVDATDMVNLTTGDLSYVMPLLDVPSPEGGYPLTLSYHAGIAIDQDASWTGLGWNVNPGSINRSISGFPDDWKEEKLSSLVYDSGGEVAYHNFSLGVGWGNGKYSAGLYGSYSENKAFGGQNSYNFDSGVYAGFNNVQGRIGSDGVGINLSDQGSVKVGSQSVTGAYSVGINYSFKTGTASFSAAANAKMNSIGTNSETKFKGSVGISAVNYFGSDRGNHGSSITTVPVGDSFSLNAQIYMFNINYSYNKIRYSLFDKKSDSGVGSLYPENITNVRNSSLFETSEGLDTYIANYDQTDDSLLNNNIVLPAYDFYSVSAQGLAGDISPKILEYGTLTPKNRFINKNGKKNSNIYYNKNSFTKKLNNNDIHFYFNNTNESYINIDSDLWGSSPSSVSSAADMVSIASPLSSLNSSLLIDGINYNGYNSSNKRKKGGSYIETFTNQQIISNSRLVYNSNNFDRNLSSVPKDGIGAFKITGSDGKTYHYTIPVYQKEKFARSAKYDEDIDNKFYEEYQTAPYATHWLLTAITGSDFVDNGDGIISDKDLGYWVTFDYGKWSDGYTWRTPRGNDFKSTPTSKIYEWGIKEIYYLNTVKTRTHTAFFIKSPREDAKSIVESKNREFESVGVTYNISSKSSKDNEYHVRGLSFDSNSMSATTAASTYATHKVNMIHDKAQHKLLKLDKIIVVKNKDIPENFGYSNPSQPASKLTASVKMREFLQIIRSDGSTVYKKDYTTIYESNWYGEFYNNILDENDINFNFPNIQNLSNKTIEFNYDYSLAKETPNTSNSTYGRLTLNKLIYKGKNGVQVLPPYSFQYENPNKTYSINNSDDWGYNNSNIDSWNLKQVTHPNGASINIKYEEDDYYTEASNYTSNFKSGLKFTFSNFLGKLRVMVENVDPTNINKINFSSFYTINQKTNINVWACIKHEYNDFGCKHRDGSINIQDEDVDVVAVSDTNVTFETTFSDHTSNQNDGLGMLLSTQYSYEMDRLQGKARNECPDLTGGCSSRTAYTLFYTINSNKILKDQNGGGLRVKQINVNSDGQNYNTNYYYNQDGFSRSKQDPNYKSSGITSYAPSKYEKNIKYLAELPPPAVLYSTVTVETNLDINKYYFKTFTPEIENNGIFSVGDILQIKKIQEQNNIPITVSNFANSSLSKYKYEIENNFSMIGTLLKQEKYNKSNHLLKKIENTYKPFAQISQGKVKETFNSYKLTWKSSNLQNQFDGTFHLNVSSKSTYPSVIQYSKIFENGIISTTSYDKFNFLTGELEETTTTSSDGETFKTKVVPAYQKYPEMGSKVDNINNKNMLSQTAVEYSYILDNNIWKETGVGITTWSNIWVYKDIAGTTVSPIAINEKIWRKHKSYIWKGTKDSNGIFTNFDKITGSGDDSFIWTIGATQPKQWKQTSEVTLYDHFSTPLEVKDVNNNYAATKMGDNDTKVIASGNARHGELFYSSAENNPILNFPTYLEPEINITNASRNSTYVHTGKYSVAATSSSQFGITMKSGQHRAGKYKISVWVEKTNAAKAKINSNGTIVDFTETYSAGRWVLKSGYITVPVGAYSINVTSVDSSTVYFDDLMIRPIASSITGYVYNEWDELSYIIGNNGLATKFEYDAGGRLTKTYSEVLDDVNNGITGGSKLTNSTAYNNRHMQ